MSFYVDASLTEKDRKHFDKFYAIKPENFANKQLGFLVDDLEKEYAQYKDSGLIMSLCGRNDFNCYLNDQLIGYRYVIDEKAIVPIERLKPFANLGAFLFNALDVEGCGDLRKMLQTAIMIATVMDYNPLTDTAQGILSYYTTSVSGECEESMDAASFEHDVMLKTAFAEMCSKALIELCGVENASTFREYIVTHDIDYSFYPFMSFCVNIYCIYNKCKQLGIEELEWFAG